MYIHSNGHKNWTSIFYSLTVPHIHAINYFNLLSWGFNPQIPENWLMQNWYLKYANARKLALIHVPLYKLPVFKTLDLQKNYHNNTVQGKSFEEKNFHS